MAGGGAAQRCPGKGSISGRRKDKWSPGDDLRGHFNVQLRGVTYRWPDLKDTPQHTWACRDHENKAETWEKWSQTEETTET